MKFFKKLGLMVFSTIVLILSIILLLISFNVIQPTIFGILITKALQSQNGTYALIGVSIVLILLSFLCLFFDDGDEVKRGKNAGIELENSDGRLLITKNTIIGLVNGVISKFPQIQDSDVDVIIDKDNNVSIDVEIIVDEDATIKEVSSKMQNEIKEVVKNSTDLEIDKVNIIVKKVESNNDEKSTEKSSKANDIDD